MAKTIEVKIPPAVSLILEHGDDVGYSLTYGDLEFIGWSVPWGGQINLFVYPKGCAAGFSPAEFNLRIAMTAMRQPRQNEGRLLALWKSWGDFHKDAKAIKEIQSILDEHFLSV